MKKLFEKLLADLVSQQLISEDRSVEFTSLFEDASTAMREIAFTEALVQVDEEHSDKLRQVIEAIDADHARKFIQVNEMNKSLITGKLKKVDEEHTAKLQTVIGMYEDSQDVKMSKSISEYLDTYLEDVVPTEELVDNAKMHRLEMAFESIKDILVINDDYVQSEVREAVLEGNSMLEDRDNEIDKLMMEKIQIQQKFNKIEATRLLEGKLEGTSPKLKSFLENKFEYSTVAEIEESFDEAITVYESEESVLRDKLIQEEQDNVITPIRKNLEERYEVTQTVPTLMEGYVSSLNKFKPRK